MVAKKKAGKAKSSIYLTEQSSEQLKEVLSWLGDRMDEMSIDAEFLEEQGELNILPLLKGLSSYLREEHLEDDEPDPVDLDEDEEEETYSEETDGELDF